MTTPQNAETAWGASSLCGKRQILRRPVLVHNKMTIEASVVLEHCIWSPLNW